MIKKNLLIGLDGNEANVKDRVGSNIYAFELLKQFYKSHLSPVTCHIFNVYLKEKPLSDLPTEHEWWQYRMVGPRKFWTQFALPRALSREKPQADVFFTLGHYMPRLAPCPVVISIMDLSYIYFPQMFRKRDLWQLRRWTARSVKKASKILTISQSSKSAIIDHYQVKPSKIVVTYPGVKINSKFNPPAAEQNSIRQLADKIQNLKKKYNINGDYLLYVGTLQPRKNLIRLIEALNILISQYPNIQLVIVGKKGWLYEKIFSKVKELNLEDKVVFTGFVPDEELPYFYQGAQCFVLVSLYEGFGLPTLEAMAYGCPVVASNVSSLPEVVGDAGISVDPEEVENIAQGIEKVLKFSPKERENLIKKGKERVKQFSWQKCAKETLKVLEEVASD